MSNLNIKIKGNTSSGFIKLNSEIPAKSIRLTGYNIICNNAPTAKTILINLEALQTSLASNSDYGFNNLSGIQLPLTGAITIQESVNRTLFIKNSRIPNKFKFTLYDGNTGNLLNESTLESIDLFFNISNPNRI